MSAIKDAPIGPQNKAWCHVIRRTSERGNWIWEFFFLLFFLKQIVKVDSPTDYAIKTKGLFRKKKIPLASEQVKPRKPNPKVA